MKLKIRTNRKYLEKYLNGLSGNELKKRGLSSLESTILRNFDTAPIKTIEKFSSIFKVPINKIVEDTSEYKLKHFQRANPNVEINEKLKEKIINYRESDCIATIIFKSENFVERN